MRLRRLYADYLDRLCETSGHLGACRLLNGRHGPLGRLWHRLVGWVLAAWPEAEPFDDVETPTSAIAYLTWVYSDRESYVWTVCQGNYSSASWVEWR